MNSAPSGPDSQRPHVTARRGFVATVGFGMVGVYFLWAAYGAAPLGFGGHGDGAGHGEEAQGGHGGHGAAPKAQIEEFVQSVQRFVEQHKLEDGSVRPRRAVVASAMVQGGHAGHGDHAAAADGEPEPVDVYLMAYQFGFLPGVLRLEAGVPYRFRMMAVDVAHGASVRIGPGARIVRLRPGALVEQGLTFLEPGEHLLYCTVYCGLAHDRMQGRIIVTQKGAQS